MAFAGEKKGAWGEEPAGRESGWDPCRGRVPDQGHLPIPGAGGKAEGWELGLHRAGDRSYGPGESPVSASLSLELTAASFLQPRLLARQPHRHLPPRFSLWLQRKDFPHGIPECGTDALRFALCSHGALGKPGQGRGWGCSPPIEGRGRVKDSLCCFHPRALAHSPLPLSPRRRLAPVCL